MFCFIFWLIGSLAWLDSSDVSYSNWINPPDVQAACGHILGDTGFQWTATENCTQELNFVCQFGMFPLDKLYCYDSVLNLFLIHPFFRLQSTKLPL